MEVNTNLIINDIMSGSNRTFFLITKFDGEHVGFLTDLSNNYKESYWINCSYDFELSLTYNIMSQVITDEKEIGKIFQYVFSDYNQAHDFFILDEIFSVIEKKKTNCLLIIGEIDKLPSGSNEILLYMIKKCPKNLKIIFTSEKFFDLNYVFSDTDSPAIFLENELIVPNKEKIDLSQIKTETIKILYALVAKNIVERDFIEEIFDAGGDAYQIFVHKYKYSAMYAGGLVVFGPSVADVMRKKYGMSDAERYDIDPYLFAYYLKKEKYIKALSLAVNMKNEAWVNEVAKIMLNSGKTIVQLYGYLTQWKPSFDFISDSKYIYATFLSVIAKYHNENDKKFVLESVQKLLNNFPEPYINALVLRFLVLCSSSYDRNETSQNLVHDFFIEGYKKYGNKALVYAMPLLEFELRGKIQSDFAKLAEEYLTDKSFSEKIWYIWILQMFIIYKAKQGKYRSCKKYIELIGQIIPFYVPTNEKILPLLFLGDANVAQNSAKKILDLSGDDKIDMNYAEAYIINGTALLSVNKAYDAISCFDNAVQSAKYGSETYYRAIIWKIIAGSITGNAEYAGNLATFYYKKFSYEKNDFEKSVFLTAKAYCSLICGKHNDAKESAIESLKVYNKGLPYAIWADAIIAICDKDEKKSNDVLEKLNENGLDVYFKFMPDLYKSILYLCAKNPNKKEYVMRIVKKMNEGVSGGELAQQIKANFFGSIGIYCNGKEVVWKTKKAKELFYFYILKGENGVSRQEIIETFWPDYVYVSAINNLKTTNNIIRNALKNNNIDFTLDYLNEKYVLKLKIDENDYDFYQKMLLKANREKDIRKRLRYVLHLIKKCNEGFCHEIKNRFFDRERGRIRSELAGVLARLIRDLKSANEIMEADRFLVILKKVVTPAEYNDFVLELGKINNESK